MDNLFEKHNIDVPNFAKKTEPKKPIESREHHHNARSQGNKNYYLSDKVKYFSQLSNIDSFFDISESEISLSSLDKPPINSLEPSPYTMCFFTSS